MSTWKAVEKRIAARLGGQRTSQLGKSTPDITTSWLVCEVKYRRKLPQWIMQALRQARSVASESQLGIVVLQERYARDGLVVCSLRDWVDWFGGLKEEEGEV